MLGEIVLPETKPETEWVRGRALQKVSPTYAHGLAQRRLAAALGQWADENRCGRVASEWRFFVAPAGDVSRPLVPDVAFLSYAALARDAAPALVAAPRMTPTVAFEILSPDDRAEDVEHKTNVYLSAGADAVVVIDTDARNAVVFDRDGRCELGSQSALTLPSLPGFEMALSQLFDD